MTDFILPIFPPNSLDSSVTTTVYIGLVVLAFFNLRFGWVASGFIVPGYLVPIIILKPLSAGIIILEGIISYLIVWLLSERLSRKEFWCPFFGRDRFFMLLLISVLVRSVCDGLLLPMLGEYLNETWHFAFDYRNNLHSFGLIISALIANHFWKPGFVRGSIPFFTILLLTWFFVRFGLMEFTNFTISSIGYMYEDLAANILASPKAYIILLTTAYIASRMNLKYGWEFSGIMVPSLMTLLWYSPFKIVTTFIEAVLVSLLAVAFLRLPAFRTISMEGTRKLVFFFTVSYCYKYLLAWFLVWKTPTFQPSDAFGFGYLLPTLLAIKMQEIHSYGKISRFVMQTSMMSIVAASTIGFALTFVPDFLITDTTLKNARKEMLTEPANVRLMDRVRSDKLILYKSRLSVVAQQPLARDIDLFARGVRLLQESIDTGRPGLRAEAIHLLGQIGYHVSLIEGRYLYLNEEGGMSRGWGIFALDTKSSKRLLIGVPAPLTEPGTLEAGAALLISQGARALAVAGSDQTGAQEASSGSRNSASLFHVFCREVSRNDVVQVRGYTMESVRLISGRRPEEGSIDAPRIDTSLWVKGSLPPGLDLKLLRESLTALKVEWRPPPFESVQRMIARTGFAELLVNTEDLRGITFKSLLSAFSTVAALQKVRIDGYLQDWLFVREDAIALRGTDSYIRPRMEELLLLDAEVVAPLVRLARSGSGSHGKSEQEKALRVIQAAASLVNYGVTVYRHLPTGHEYYILSEREGSGKKRYWGTYVFRIGSSSGYVIQIPRPLYEVNSFEYGVTLFERMSARALLVGGCHPDANQDGSSDLVSSANKENVFNLVNQIVLREEPDTMMVIQSRTFGLNPDAPSPEAGTLLAFSNGAVNRREVSKMGQSLLKVLDEDRMSSRFVDGSKDVAGYEIGVLSQAQYLNETKNKEFMILWLSPTARASYRQQQENRRLDAQFQALGIVSVEGDLFSVIERQPRNDSARLPTHMRARLMRYFATQDMVVLNEIITGFSPYRFKRVIDSNSRQAFLLISNPDGKLAAIANLVPRRPDRTMKGAAGSLQRSDISGFVDSRMALFEFGGAP